MLRTIKGKLLLALTLAALLPALILGGCGLTAVLGWREVTHSSSETRWVRGGSSCCSSSS